MNVEYKSAGVAQLSDLGALGDGWTITGLGSTYELDAVSDRVMPGAYADTIRERPKIPLLWSHDTGEPIGRVEQMTETSQGLWFKAKLSDTRRGRDVKALMSDSALSGVSIGYSVARSSYHTEDGKRVRRLHKINLHELSMVVFPAAGGARASLKSAWHDALVIAEYEARKGGIYPRELERKYNRILRREVGYYQQQIGRELERERMLEEINAAMAELKAL